MAKATEECVLYAGGLELGCQFRAVAKATEEGVLYGSARSGLWRRRRKRVYCTGQPGQGCGEGDGRGCTVRVSQVRAVAKATEEGVCTAGV